MKSILIATSFVLFPLLAVAYGGKGFQLIRSEGDLFYYEGNIAVSGTYSWQLNEIEQGALCFFVKGPTEKLIPREHDSRMPWFCFSNDREAKIAFNIPSSVPKGVCEFSGQATIRISEYVVNRMQSSVHDTAKLEEIVSRTDPALKQCEPRP
jgi:hypothetical protein